MIFASVGSMLPFDRFVQAIDEWARCNPKVDVFIQIGDGGLEPRYASYTRVMPLFEYRERLRSCNLFVAHVGMGAILQALEFGKQALLLPRLHALGEHTTNHQIHTAARFRHTKGLFIVDDVIALHREMSRLLDDPMEVGSNISNQASPELLQHVASFLAASLPRHRE